MHNKLISQFFLCFVTFICFESFSQNNFSLIKHNIFNGNLNDAEKLINTNLKQTSFKEQTQLLHLKGDIYKIKGDIDAAYTFWLKSNEIRANNYPKGDYHLAWNHALLSNYHYEKVQVELAKAYADSCAALLQNLTENQQKEIEIYRIWNILGQSYKQQAFNQGGKLFDQNCSNYYESIIRPFYLNAIAFQEKYHTEPYYLANSYHLLANSFTDIILKDFNTNLEKGKINYKKGFDYYQQSINILTKEFGAEHYRIGLSYFVRTLLTGYASSKIKNSDAIRFSDFKKSLKAFGISNNRISQQALQKNPNKEDLLMCLQHYTRFLKSQFVANNKINYLVQSENINDLAIELWELIYSEFESKNINQNLSIYGLVPFSETIKIELLKKKKGVKWSKEKIFTAAQKLKYYDFNKWQKSKKNQTVSSILTIQNKLKLGECFIDIIESNYFMFITKDSVWIDAESAQPTKKIKILNQAIINFDYDIYTTTAKLLYDTLFANFNLKQFSKLIICADGIYNQLPFTALLPSNKNNNLNDYRKLDYLVNHTHIQYVLSADSYLCNATQKTSLSVAAFAPVNLQNKLTELPFSEQMVTQLNNSAYANGFLKEKAILHYFLNAKTTVLHVSSHGLIDQQNALNSALVFSDSLLYLSNVYHSTFKQKLVVLNTCNSALGKYRVGDGVDGFIRAFHAKGVPTTLSNIWEVDDKVSNELLFDFYTQLSKGEIATNALVLSQKDLIANAKSSKMASPYYWAGHRLVGEEVEFKVVPQTDNWFWYVVFGSLGLLMVVFWNFLRKK